MRLLTKVNQGSETPAPPVTPRTSTSGPAQQHHRGRRLRNFLLPNGREVHIALSPEEAESLRQRLQAVRSADEPFDLVINGSPEHLDALREAHTHHESRREALRERHGSEVFDEFEAVRNELDALGSELHMLTDHAVSLDANFSKYGYSAHLRTYEKSSDEGGEGKSRHGSETSSLSGWHSEDEHEKKDWAAERRNGRTMKVYKKPTVRQYFHKGLLWRASETTEVASFELFLDLLYVGILAINGDHAAEDSSGHELLRFSITFIMSWKIWGDMTMIVAWFETDDIMQRVAVLFTMACLLGLTTNMLEAFDSTYTMLISFYLAARLFMCSYLLTLVFTLPMIRGMMIGQIVALLVPSVLWIVSIQISMPNRLAAIWIAIFLDITGPMILFILIRSGQWIGSQRLKDWLDRVFEFYPAINIEHKVERTNAFVTLVFGYSVVAIIYQSSAPFGLNAFYGKAVLGLVQAFCFNWIYFELDGAELFSHAIRRNYISSMFWTTAHLPFIMSYVLGAAALSRLVIANDCRDANTEDLTETYAEKSESEIPVGLRWFYCAGLGIALFCMGIISLSHIHKDPATGLRLSKKFRMLNRFGVCIILVCLPTATSLNSLQLISIVTGLIVWILLLELWGCACPEESFFGEKKKCRYTARCSRQARKDIEIAARSGRVLKCSSLEGKGEKALFQMS